MTDAPDDPKSRAARLRERIARLKHEAEEPESGDPTPDEGPRPGESPQAYVERRMRETLKKKDEPES